MVNEIDEDNVKKNPGNYVPNIFHVDNASYLVIPSSKEELDVLGISSLQPSDKVAEKNALTASVPHLSQPEFYATNLDKLTQIGLSSGGLDGVSQDGRLMAINLSAFTYSLENKYHEIIISMLDKWAESIDEDEARLREKLLSTAHLNWIDEMNLDFFEMKDISRMSASEFKRYMMDTSFFTLWVDSLPPDKKIEQLNHGTRYRILVGMENGIKGYQENLETNGPSLIAPFIVASLAIGSTLLGPYVKMITSGIQTAASAGLNPIVSSVVQIGQPLINMNLAALGYFGALFGTGVLYQTSDQVALNVGQLPDKEVSVTFAREYGKNMIKLLDTPDFNLFLNAAVINLVQGGKPVSESESLELINAMKLVLLITSLGIIYKSETGKITDREVGAMLTDEIPIGDDPVKLELKEQILSLVSSLDKLQQPMLNAALEYLNSDPSFDELFDVYRVFKGIRQSEELSGEVHFKARS